MTQIAVAVVSFNTRDLLARCLESIPRHEAARVLVIDHGSSDGSVAMVEERFPFVEIHSDPSNPGYGAAVNHAMALTSEPCLLVLNSDTVLSPGSIRDLSKELNAHAEVAVLGPRLINADGSLEPSLFPFPHPVLTPLHLTGLDRAIAWMPRVRTRLLEIPPGPRARSVPWLRGAVLALRRSAFEDLGGFREDYFMYWEETDFCLRAHDAGWDVLFTPRVEVVHFGGASTDRVGLAMEVQLYRSLVTYFRLNGGSAAALVTRVMIRACAMVNIVTSNVRRLLMGPGASRRGRKDRRDLWWTLAIGAWNREEGPSLRAGTRASVGPDPAAIARNV